MSDFALPGTRRRPRYGGSGAGRWLWASAWAGEGISAGATQLHCEGFQRSKGGAPRGGGESGGGEGGQGRMRGGGGRARQRGSLAARRADWATSSSQPVCQCQAAASARLMRSGSTWPVENIAQEKGSHRLARHTFPTGTSSRETQALMPCGTELRSKLIPWEPYATPPRRIVKRCRYVIRCRYVVQGCYEFYNRPRSSGASWQERIPVFRKPHRGRHRG